MCSISNIVFNTYCKGRHENANTRTNRYKMSKLVKSIRPISFRANLLSSRLKSTSQHLLTKTKKKHTTISFFYSNGRLVILLPSQFLQFQILTKVTIRFYPGRAASVRAAASWALQQRRWKRLIADLMAILRQEHVHTIRWRSSIHPPLWAEFWVWHRHWSIELLFCFFPYFVLLLFIFFGPASLLVLCFLTYIMFVFLKKIRVYQLRLLPSWEVKYNQQQWKYIWNERCGNGKFPIYVWCKRLHLSPIITKMKTMAHLN